MVLAPLVQNAWNEIVSHGAKLGINGIDVFPIGISKAKFPDNDAVIRVLVGFIREYRGGRPTYPAVAVSGVRSKNVARPMKY